MISINQGNEELPSDDEENTNEKAGNVEPERQYENYQTNAENASSPNVVLLAERCGDNNYLRKDAVFIHKLGKFLANAKNV